jgi:hypothetical protein
VQAAEMAIGNRLRIRNGRQIVWLSNGRLLQANSDNA